MEFNGRQRMGGGPLGPRDLFLPLCTSSFLVGYSTCHWCHMMEEESFQNEEIARLLNEDFVSVKVDREERPDVDKVYMTFVQVSESLVTGCLVTPVHGSSPDPGTLALSGHQQWRGLAHERVADAQPPAICRGHLFPTRGWFDSSRLPHSIDENP